MCAYGISVNQDHYVVETDDALVGWKSDVIDAVRRGGGFVEMTSMSGMSTAILITPSSTITVQKIVSGDAEGAAAFADDMHLFEDL
jgi:hypothetical protein